MTIDTSAEKKNDYVPENEKGNADHKHLHTAESIPTRLIEHCRSVEGA